MKKEKEEIFSSCFSSWRQQKKRRGFRDLFVFLAL